jgi:outer membrane protein assembly factor BamB
VGDGLGEANVRLAPALDERYVAVASHDGLLAIFERNSGKRVWKKDSKYVFSAGPALAYGVVVVATEKGDVLAFSETDGSEKWRVNVGAKITAAPAVSADAVVVLAADGVVHALARENGESRWTYNTTVPVLSLHANAAPLLDANDVYVATSGGKLLNLDLQSGVSAWELRVASNNGRTDLERMADVAANLLLLNGNTLFSVGYQSQLTATDAGSGRRRWQFDVSSVNDAAEGLGNIYLSDIGGNVLAVDEVSGKSVWKQKDFAWHKLSNPVVVSNVLALGDDEGKVHLLAQSDGAVRGRVSVSGDAIVSLQVRDDILYCQDDDGDVSAWQVIPYKGFF